MEYNRIKVDTKNNNMKNNKVRFTKGEAIHIIIILTESLGAIIIIRELLQT